MNYNFETIMSWIMYMKTGIWEIQTENDYHKDPDLVINKFEELFKNEIAREVNDGVHSMFNVHKHIGTISVRINPETISYKVYDNYNTLMCIYNGIYGEFDGLKLCLDTKAHGFSSADVRYFKFCEIEDDRFVSIKSIVLGTTKNKSPNARRMISILFSRPFQYSESTNPEQKMLMDYSEEEKAVIFQECLNYDGKKLSKNNNNSEEE